MQSIWKYILPCEEDTGKFHYFTWNHYSSRFLEVHGEESPIMQQHDIWWIWKKLCKRHWTYNLSQKKNLIAHNYMHVECRNKWCREFFNYIIWFFFFLGVQNSFPKSTEPTKHVQYNSVLNFVDGSNQMSQIVLHSNTMKLNVR